MESNSLLGIADSMPFSRLRDLHWMAAYRPSPRRTATTSMVYGLEGVFALGDQRGSRGWKMGYCDQGVPGGSPPDAYGSNERDDPLVCELCGDQGGVLDVRGESALYARSVKRAQFELSLRGEHAAHDAGYLSTLVIHVGWV